MHPTKGVISGRAATLIAYLFSICNSPIVSTQKAARNWRRRLWLLVYAHGTDVAAAGSPPYGITFSEWALSNPAAWAYLAPRHRVENGRLGAIHRTTARGRNHRQVDARHGQDARRLVFSEVLPVNVTGAMSEAVAVEQQRVEYTGIFGKGGRGRSHRPGILLRASRRPFSARTGSKEMLSAEQQGRICDVPDQHRPCR